MKKEEPKIIYQLTASELSQFIRKNRPMGEFIDVEQVSLLTGLADTTIRLMKSRGEIPCRGRIGPKLIFRKSEIIAWMESRITDLPAKESK